MLVEIEEVRQELATDPKLDGMLQRRLDSVTALWNRLTNRYWDYGTGTETFSPGETQNALFLKRYPVETIEVSWWNRGQTVNDAQVMLAGDFIIDLPTGVLSREPSLVMPTGWFDEWPGSSGTRVWPRFLSAVVTGGYTSETCPADVKEVIITQLKYTIAKTKTDKINVRSHGAKGSSTSLMQEALHPDFDLLARSLRRNVR